MSIALKYTAYFGKKMVSFFGVHQVLLTTILISFCGYTGSAQELNKAKLDSFFHAMETNEKIFGKVAVSKGGTNVYTRSLGFADFENNINTQEATKYRIGSISKTFTAALVLKALEEEKLQLEQTIEVYFPTIKNAEEITIAHLLGHRSGIHNFTDDKDYSTWSTQPMKEEDMIKKISEIGSDFEPGSKGAYSNSNYVILTYILEKVYDRSYAELLSHYITEPLGLSDTYLGGKIDPANGEAKSYRFTNHWQIEPETDPSIPLGAGNIVSTPEDIIAFGEALLAGKIISEENVNLMKTIRDGYGMGLFQYPFYEKKLYGHNGGIDGFVSMWGYSPEDNVSFAFTSNGNNMNTNDIAVAVLSAVYDRPFDIPVFSSYAVSEEDLEQYLGTYSSEQMPLKITVTMEDKALFAQATGQPLFPLEATEKDKFKFDQAGVVMEFDPAKNTMLLKQHGQQFSFTKETEELPAKNP